MVGFLRLAARGLWRMGVLWAAAAWASCTSGSDMPRGAGMLGIVRNLFFGQAVFAPVFFVELCLLFGV